MINHDNPTLYTPRLKFSLFLMNLDMVEDFMDFSWPLWWLWVPSDLMMVIMNLNQEGTHGLGYTVTRPDRSVREPKSSMLLNKITKI